MSLEFTDGKIRSTGLIGCAAGKSYDKAILKAKDVCKKAGINIPTVIYKKKGKDEILDAISALLEKHDLDRNSGRGEIAAARAKIQKAKDLEGESASIQASFPIIS